MNLVAAWITKIHLTMLNNGVGPIGYIQRPIRTLFYINWPEMSTTTANEIAQMLSSITGTILGKVKPNNTVRAKITGNGLPLKTFGKMWASQNLQSGKFGIITRANGIHYPTSPRIGAIHCARNSVADPLKTCSISDKRLPVSIKMMAPGIHPTTVLDTCLLCIRTQPHHPATLESYHPMWSLQMAPNVNGLVEVKTSIVSPAKRVQRMVGVLSTKTR